MKGKDKVIIIAGPTASGKTDISIRLARVFDGEIISADSMQIYKHMDVGTAKIKREEMNGIKHHMIDIIEPDQNYSVAEFQNECRSIIKDITSSNKLPFIVGGTYEKLQKTSIHSPRGSHALWLRTVYVCGRGGPAP